MKKVLWCSNCHKRACVTFGETSFCVPCFNATQGNTQTRKGRRKRTETPVTPLFSTVRSQAELDMGGPVYLVHPA